MINPTLQIPTAAAGAPWIKAGLVSATSGLRK
jgi:hypothetical protein